GRRAGDERRPHRGAGHPRRAAGQGRLLRRAVSEPVRRRAGGVSPFGAGPVRVRCGSGCGPGAGPCAVLRLSGLPCGEPVEDPPAGRTFGDWLIFRPWPVKFALLAGRWRAPKIGFSFNGVPLDCVLSNGVSLNGVALNRVSPNGVSLNGVALNRVSPNGISLNGVTGYESP